MLSVCVQQVDTCTVTCAVFSYRAGKQEILRIILILFILYRACRRWTKSKAEETELERKSGAGNIRIMCGQPAISFLVMTQQHEWVTCIKIL